MSEHPLATIFRACREGPVGGDVDVALGRMLADGRAAWPGNVRELKNVLERALLLADDGVIRAELVHDLLIRGSRPRPGAAAPASFLTLRELERQQIERALERTGGNVSKAAQLLGIDRRTLQRKQAELRGEPADGTFD